MSIKTTKKGLLNSINVPLIYSYLKFWDWALLKIYFSVFTLSQGEDSLDHPEMNMIRCKSLSVTVKLYKNAFKNFFKCILTGPVSFTVTAVY